MLLGFIRWSLFVLWHTCLLDGNRLSCLLSFCLFSNLLYLIQFPLSQNTIFSDFSSSAQHQCHASRAIPHLWSVPVPARSHFSIILQHSNLFWYWLLWVFPLEVPEFSVWQSCFHGGMTSVVFHCWTWPGPNFPRGTSSSHLPSSRSPLISAQDNSE